MWLINFFIFMTTAFPKAGMMIGGVAITIAEILFAMSLIKSKKKLCEFFSNNKGWLYIYIIYAITIVFSTLINLRETSLFRIAISVVLTMSPLAVGIGYKAEKNIVANIIMVSLVIVGGFALIQWIFGIEKTAIPGLVIAYGDSFANKTNGNGLNGMEASKMPGTYQVGNGAGLFYLLGLTSILSVKTKNSKLKNLSIVLGVVGILLSGSRSCLIPFVLFLPIIIKTIYSKLKKNGKLSFILVGIIILIGIFGYSQRSNTVFFKYFYERNIKTTLSDTTGSGRTTMIKNGIEYMANQNLFENIKILISGIEWNKGISSEGIMYIFFKYGIISTISFLLLLIIPIIKLHKKNKIISIGLIGVFIAFCVDSSFNNPPSLMNYFLIVGVFMKNIDLDKLERNNKKNDENSNNNIWISTSASN